MQITEELIDEDPQVQLELSNIDPNTENTKPTAIREQDNSDSTNTPPITKADAEIPEQTPKVPEDKKNFGAMNGVSVEFESQNEQPHADEQQTPPQPEEIVTTRAFSQHPVLKAAVIGSGIFLVVVVAGSMINASMNALTNSTTVKPQPVTKAVDTDTESESQSENPGKIKTALAVTSQKPELESLRNLPKPTTTTKQPTTTTNQQSTVNTPVKTSPTSSTSSVPASSPTRQRQYYSVTQGQGSNQPTTKRSSPTPTRPNYQESALTTSLKSTPRTVANSSSISNKQNKDPMQQWLAVSSVGSFSAGNTETPPSESVSTKGIQGGIGTPKSLPSTLKSADNDSTNYSQNTRRVLVGTRTEGKLETPIALSAGSRNQSQKYLVRLTKPLKGADGAEVLPVDSYLVVVPSNNASEYIQMSAIAALININGNTLEKPLTENSILILNRNGETLRAQSRKGSSLSGDFMAAVIAGVSKAAEIENNPSTQTSISSSVRIQVKGY